MSWVTVERAKLSAALANVDSNVLLKFIAAAESFVKKHTHRDTLESNAVIEYHDGDGSRSMLVDAYPLTTLTKITILDVVDSSNDEELTLTDFIVKEAIGQIIWKPGIAGYFPVGIQNIKVEVTGGLGTIEEDLVTGTVLIVIWLYEAESIAERIKKKRLGDYEIEYNTLLKSIPSSALELLANYVDSSGKNWVGVS